MVFKRNPNTRIVSLSLTVEQFAELEGLMAEDKASNFSFYVSRLIVDERKRRLGTLVQEGTARPVGRPRKQPDPADDENAPKTIRNPFISDPKDEHYMINAHELAIAKAMRGE
ncbi:MAG: hypothetical protein U1D31_03400 [Patescibacteria group bacterium]|nr:hypothetical protein [Patescibacteria group bacterium]